MRTPPKCCSSLIDQSIKAAERAVLQALSGRSYIKICHSDFLKKKNDKHQTLKTTIELVILKETEFMIKYDYNNVIISK